MMNMEWIAAHKDKLQVLGLSIAVLGISVAIIAQFNHRSWTVKNGMVTHPLYGTYPEEIAYKEGMTLYPGQRANVMVLVSQENGDATIIPDVAHNAVEPELMPSTDPTVSPTPIPNPLPEPTPIPNPDQGSDSGSWAQQEQPPEPEQAQPPEESLQPPPEPELPKAPAPDDQLPPPGR